METLSGSKPRSFLWALFATGPFILEGTVKIDIFSLSLVRRNTTQRPFWAAPLLRRTSAFTKGENLGARAALPPESIKKDTTQVVSFFMVEAGRVEPCWVLRRLLVTRCVFCYVSRVSGIWIDKKRILVDSHIPRY